MVHIVWERAKAKVIWDTGGIFERRLCVRFKETYSVPCQVMLSCIETKRWHHQIGARMDVSMNGGGSILAADF